MHFIDIAIFVFYMVAMLGVGFYFMRKNANADDYYVGGRSMGPLHVGLSVVATDVGGGFSIGLGGLGFTMGLSGSWMLFTGLIGAWLAAVVLIPKVSSLAKKHRFLTLPQLYGHFFDRKTALAAGVISAIGYLGFTSSQILAGAKLAAASFEGLQLTHALIIMGVIAVVYTVMGGIKAVIYTDTVQWIILMAGLILIGIPLGYEAIGGLPAIRETLGPEMLELNNIGWKQFFNWSITIIPIWFVGMTLYQRIYACKGPKEARRAWFAAGLFEWPVMAFMGVVLGLFSRVAFEQGLLAPLGFEPGGTMDSEMGLPAFLRTILPVGLMGLMMSAYFSAIMSTADSCLMACSGNILTDILGKKHDNGEDADPKTLDIALLEKQNKSNIRVGQIITLAIGVVAILIATMMEEVLDLMLYSYAFMVSGLFVPILGGLYWKHSTPNAAFWSMLSGGTCTLALTLSGHGQLAGLDANLFGILTSLIVFVAISYSDRKSMAHL